MLFPIIIIYYNVTQHGSEYKLTSVGYYIRSKVIFFKKNLKLVYYIYNIMKLFNREIHIYRYTTSLNISLRRFIIM